MGYYDIEREALARSVPRLLGRRRPTKFSPERIEQIKYLIECGKSCEEIAALIGVTVGTLKVTCSKLGISLRRPKLRNGSRLLPVGVAQFVMKASAIFAIIMQYKGEERTNELPLTPAMIGQLGLEASSRDLSITEFASDLVVKVLKKGILREVLASDSGPATE